MNSKLMVIAGAALVGVASIVLAEEPDPETPTEDVGKPEDKARPVSYDTRDDRPAPAAPATAPAAGHEQVLAQWAGRSLEVATALIEKYGAPDEATASMLVWRRNGPWKRTIVHAEGVDHSFPWPHSDVLEQVIDYPFPVDQLEELAAFDGSISVHRTRGELSVRCHEEWMSFLALNLAHDLAGGKIEPAAARRSLGEATVEMLKSKKKRGEKWTAPAYTTGFQFDVPVGGTEEPDKPFKASTARR